MNEPINLLDPSGLSKLIFDRSRGELEIWPDNWIGPPFIFAAGNYTVNQDGDPLQPESFGPAPNGLFDIGRIIETGLDPCSSFGSGFFRINLPGKESGEHRTGVGLHAGRRNAGGVKHITLGCIRTTEEALEVLRNDLPTQILIQE